jgi:uncharacterized protein
VDIVWVRARKWPDRPHYTYKARVLGEDAHGHWFGVPCGTLWRRPGVREGLSRQVEVLLAPPRGWWVAAWQGEPSTSDLSVHVTTPPDYGDGCLTCFDLDLDVLRWRDGSVTLVDEDEFEDHRVRFGYPPEIVKEATTTAAWLQEVVAERRPPFDSTGEVWLWRFEKSLHFLRSPSRADLPNCDGCVTASGG